MTIWLNIMKPSILPALENLFLALSDKTRLQLVALMADGEVTVGELVEQLGQSQPKISRHLAYLRGAGLVSARRDGKWVYYGLAFQTNAEVDRVYDATISAISPKAGSRSIQNDDPNRTSTQAYDAEPIDDWTPQEIEIYLL